MTLALETRWINNRILNTKDTKDTKEDRAELGPESKRKSRLYTFVSFVSFVVKDFGSLGVLAVQPSPCAMDLKNYLTTRATEVVRGVSGVKRVVKVFEYITEDELRAMQPRRSSSLDQPTSKPVSLAPPASGGAVVTPIK